MPYSFSCHPVSTENDNYYNTMTSLNLSLLSHTIAVSTVEKTMHNLEAHNCNVMLENQLLSFQLYLYNVLSGHLPGVDLGRGFGS